MGLLSERLVHIAFVAKVLYFTALWVHGLTVKLSLFILFSKRQCCILYFRYKNNMMDSGGLTISPCTQNAVKYNTFAMKTIPTMTVWHSKPMHPECCKIQYFRYENNMNNDINTILSLWKQYEQWLFDNKPMHPECYKIQYFRYENNMDSDGLTVSPCTQNAVKYNTFAVKTIWKMMVWLQAHAPRML